jgi:hypothetical protein
MQPSFSSEAYTPDRLIAGDFPVRTQTVTLDTGSLVRGEVLGKITRGTRTATGAADVPAPAGATITASPAATLATETGVHRFVCITSGATGKFRHYDPAGQVVGDATTGTEYTGGGLTLTITDSGTDPAVGEALKVTVTAAAASGKYIKCSTDAIDGSSYPRGILAEDTDASSADVDTTMYICGEFNADLVDWDGSYGNITAQAFLDALREQSIILKTPVSA